MRRVVVLLLVTFLVLSLAGCTKGAKAVSMLVYLDEELSEAEARALGTELNMLPEVTEIKFVSGEVAWSDFLGSQEDSEAFTGLDMEGILRHRFEVIAQTADAEALAERIEEIEGVDEVELPLELSWFQKMMWKLRQ